MAKEQKSLTPLPKPVRLDLPGNKPPLMPRRKKHGDSPPIYVNPDDFEIRTPRGNGPRKPEPKRRKDMGRPHPKHKQNRRFKSKKWANRGNGLHFRLPKIRLPRISKKVKKVLSMGTVAAAAVALVVFLVFALSNHNALAVYLDGRFVGYISMNADLDSQIVHDQAVAHLESSLGGTSVIVDQRVTIESARARQADILQRAELNRLLANGFTYQVLAMAIFVDGNFEALVRTEACAQEVQEIKQEPFITSNTISVEFLVDFDVFPEVVNLEEEDILDPHAVVTRLDRPVNTLHAYTIQSGDFLGAIALRFNTTPERIAANNNMTTSAILQPGNVLQIETQRPLLSVRTVDETLTTEPIPMQVEVRQNPDLPESQRNVIQEGQDGEQQIARRITRIDGVQVNDEILQDQIIRAAVTHIIEEGTGQAVIERR